MAEAMVSATTDQSQLPVVMRGMSQEAWEAFFRTLLPQETLEVDGRRRVEFDLCISQHADGFGSTLACPAQSQHGQ